MPATRSTSRAVGGRRDVRVLARLFAVGLYFLGVSVSAASSLGQEEPKPQDTSLLSEQVDLARLLDLCAQRLHLNLEYDPAVVKGTLTFRFSAGVSDQELWTLTNRLLASHGFTTVQMSGDTLSVVKLAEAAGLARVEDGDPAKAVAGFVKVLRPLKFRTSKEVVQPLTLVLSKPGGAATPAENESLVLVADLKPQLLRALQVLDLIDAPRGVNVLREYETKHLPATDLATLVDRVLSSQAGLEGKTSAGKVLATPDERRVLVIAPESEAGRIVEFLAKLDQREAQQAVTYAPKSFSVREVAHLIEQVLAGEAVPSGAPPFKLVEDDLTGTVLLTATTSQHARVAALLERLDSVATASRRPIRTFSLKNRSVTEVVELLRKLISAGAIAPIGGSESEAGAGAESGAKSGATQAGTTPPSSPNVTKPATQVQTPPQTPPPTARPPSAVVNAPDQGVVLSADEGTNTLVAVGEPRMLDQIERLLRTLDVRQPQVMVEAFVVALSHDDTLDLGVELQKLGVDRGTLGRISSLFGLGSPDPASASLPPPSGLGFSGVVLDPKSYSAILKALETVNHGRTLTVPHVLVNNNQQGKLDSVLQTPFTSTNASTTVATTSFGGTQDAGTMISVRPQIAEGDHLRLEYDVTVSAFVGSASNPALPPPRQQDKIQSIVTIPDGYTVVVGGLDIVQDTVTTAEVPWLGRLWLIGFLFRNDSTEKKRSRLYVFLRANVLRRQDFEDLKFLSGVAANGAELDDGTPRAEPRFIR